MPNRIAPSPTSRRHPLGRLGAYRRGRSDQYRGSACFLLTLYDLPLLGREPNGSLYSACTTEVIERSNRLSVAVLPMRMT